MNRCTIFRRCLLVAIGLLMDCSGAAAQFDSVAQLFVLPAGLTTDAMQSGAMTSHHGGLIRMRVFQRRPLPTPTGILCPTCSTPVHERPACSRTTSEPWDDATCRTLRQGACLGNGDFGIHLGGTKHSLVYCRGKNGFHAGNNLAGAEGDGKWTQHILNLAILTVEKSGGTDAGDDYHVTQDLKNSETRTCCSMAGAGLWRGRMGQPLRTRSVRSGARRFGTPQR